MFIIGFVHFLALAGSRDSASRGTFVGHFQIRVLICRAFSNISNSREFHNVKHGKKCFLFSLGVYYFAESHAQTKDLLWLVD